MTKTILAFGDSNTHGTAPQATPGSFDRYPPEVRWPVVAHGALPDDWHLVEEGLPGRTTCFRDPLMGDHMEGWLGFKIALMTHAKVDLITIMLGTNDAKDIGDHGPNNWQHTCTGTKESKLYMHVQDMY